MSKATGEEIYERYPAESPHALATWPTDTPEQIARLEAVIASTMTALDAEKWPRALQWFQNRAFLAGQHFVHFAWDGNSLSADDAASGLRRSAMYIPKQVDNRLVRPFEQTISAALSSKPNPRAVPVSDLPEDEDAATLAEIAFRTVWDSEPLHMRRRYAALWGTLMCDGTAGWEVTYQPEHCVVPVPKVEYGEDPNALPGVLVEQETDEDDYTYQPGIASRIYNGFQLQPNPDATDDPSSIYWLSASSFQDIGCVKEQYDRDDEGFIKENLDRIHSHQTFDGPLYWHERIRDLIDTPAGSSYGVSTGSLAGNATLGPNQTLFRMIDVKPNPYYPRGRTLVLAGDRLIYAGPSRAWSERYPERWTPIHLFRYWEVPGRFWGMPMFSPLIPLQKRINQIDALVHINRQNISIGQWLIPHTAKVPDGFISASPNRNIPYRASHTGAKPERVTNTPLPSELLVERDMLVAAIEYISGTQDIVTGNNPSGVRSGVMLDFLSRQANKSKIWVHQNIDSGTEKVAASTLIELAELGDDSPIIERIRNAARDVSPLAAENFAAADLRDNALLKIDTVSELLKSPEADSERAGQVLQFAPNLAQLSPVMQQKVTQAMGLNDLQPGVSTDVNKMRRVISLLRQGLVTEPEQLNAFVLPGIDDTGVCLSVLIDAMKHPKMFQAEAHVVQGILFLIDAYKKIAAEEQMQAMQAAAVQQSMAMVEAGKRKDAETATPPELAQRQ